MRRTERLFQIIQILRRNRRPITGADLAEELEVSLRTVYRDMAELVAQRIPIRGEAGTGYVLDDGYDLPPLMLTPDEIEAAILGAKWVAGRGDPSLRRAAIDLISKIRHVVPQELEPVLLDDKLEPLSFSTAIEDSVDVAPIRKAIRERRKISIGYKDDNGRKSSRIVWPFLIGYLDHIRMIAAWCELRDDFRHFRTDRIESLSIRSECIPERLDLLQKRWKKAMQESNYS